MPSLSGAGAALTRSLERAAGMRRAAAEAAKAKRLAKEEMRESLRRRYEADLATLDDAPEAEADADAE